LDETSPLSPFMAKAVPADPISSLDGFGGLLVDQPRLALPGHNLLRDQHLLDVRLRRDVSSQIRHDAFHDSTHATRAGHVHKPPRARSRAAHPRIRLSTGVYG
jgi:hypothetical protein